MVNAHHKEVADVYVEDGIVVAVRPHIMVILFLLINNIQLFFMLRMGFFYFQYGD